MDSYAAKAGKYQTQPTDLLKDMWKEKGVSAAVIYELGAYTHKWLSLTTTNCWALPASLSGSNQVNNSAIVKLRFFDTPRCSGMPLTTQCRISSLVDLFDLAPSFLFFDSQHILSALPAPWHPALQRYTSLKSHPSDTRVCMPMTKYSSIIQLGET